MFQKILIANRGEIACRVIRTARRRGVRTVAVYSDADAASLHVAEADEAVHIGASPVAESYLRGDRIVEAAKATGAEAIHPGYGFLSENPDFVDQVKAAGLVFIGPSAASIRAMGLKDAAKRLMEQIVSGDVKLDQVTLDSAKSTLAYNTASAESTVADATDGSFANQVLRGQTRDVRRQRLAKTAVSRGPRRRGRGGC